MNHKINNQKGAAATGIIIIILIIVIAVIMLWRSKAEKPKTIEEDITQVETNLGELETNNLNQIDQDLLDLENVLEEEPVTEEIPVQ